jgi:hypothetical protein
VISGANGNDTANDESALFFYNLTGTSAINRGTYSGGFEDNLHVLNENDMAGGLTVSNATFGFNSTANGNNSISVEARGADAYIAFTLQDSFIRGARSDFINALPSFGSLDIVIDNNTFSNTGANAHPSAVANGNRILLQALDGTANIEVTDNIINGSLGSAIATTSIGSFGGGGGGVANYPDRGQPDRRGGDREFRVRIQSDGGGDVAVVINENQIRQYNNHGILFTATKWAMWRSSMPP